MRSIEDTWQDLAARQHGVVSRAQLAAAGLSYRQIRLRSANGTLKPVFPQVLRVAGSPATFEQAVMAATLGSGGVASHRCAGALWQLRGCEAQWIEVVVGGRRQPDLPGVVAHSTRRLDTVDVTQRRGIPVTTPARTLLDLGAVVPEEVVESALEDALHRELVTRAWLERLLQRVGAPGRDGTAVLRRLLAERATGVAPTESPLEDALVRVLRRAGLPDPVRQHWVRAPGAPPVRVDLAYPEARLAIEVQSLAWHAGRADLQRDCEKHNVLARLGWRLLVFTHADIHRRPRAAAASVSDLLFGGEATFGGQATLRVAASPQRFR